MNSENRQSVISVQLLRKKKILCAIRRLQLLATAIVFLTALVAFALPHTPTTVFISLFAFLIVQVFATKEYAQLALLTRRIRLLSKGPYFQQQYKIPWTVPAGVAVKDTYFVLLLVFDISWLSHAYLRPSPANSFDQFLQQLAIGPIGGMGFVIFTVALWAFYAYLFVIGSLYTEEINSTAGNSEALFEKQGSSPQEIWIQVRLSAQQDLYLQGQHLSNPDKQPLILFPGFYQNGNVYDLSEEASLARYLWEAGFDVWIIHPRGTALSDGRSARASLDDFAGNDIPAVIRHVLLKTGKKPVFVGHSQGGISAIISLMGTSRPDDQTVLLSDAAAEERQQSLQGLVVLGSFLDFTFSKPAWLKSFVEVGLSLTLGRWKMRIVSSKTLLKLSMKFIFLGMPVSYSLRSALVQSKKARLTLFPLVLIFNFIASLKLWEFLYHIPNVSRPNRKRLFYRTMDGTFSQILKQFQFAVAKGKMESTDGTINYSGHYHRLKLPVSVVAMEYDALADPVMMKTQMFDAIGSERKVFTLWKGMGHEDHFTDPVYFPQVLEAIKAVC